MAETVRDVMSGAIKMLGVQVTGGTLRARQLGEAARRRRGGARDAEGAAAKEAGVARADLSTEAGAVILPGGERLPYTALAARAAEMEPVTDVALKTPSEWRLIGSPMQRLDIVAKSTGTQGYGIDVTLPGMVHAAVRLSPTRAGLASYDASAAEAMPGVTHVLEIGGGLAVVANNSWTAMKAAHAVTCEWEAAPYPAEQEGHWAALSEAFTEDLLDKEWRHDGDVDAALEGAETRSRRSTARPMWRIQPLEPLNATALMEDGTLEIWAAHQMPRFLQDVGGRGGGRIGGGRDLPQRRRRRQFRASPRIREHPRGGRDRGAGAGHTGEADLFARGGFRARFPPPDRHGAGAGGDPGRTDRRARRADRRALAHRLAILAARYAAAGTRPATARGSLERDLRDREHAGARLRGAGARAGVVVAVGRAPRRRASSGRPFSTN